MDTVTLTINNTEYVEKFDYSWTRAVADLWGFKYPSEVTKKLQSIRPIIEKDKKGKVIRSEFSFEDFDVLRDVFYTSIQTNNKTNPFENPNELLNYFIKNQEDFIKLISLLQNSHSDPEKEQQTQGKPKRVKKAS